MGGGGPHWACVVGERLERQGWRGAAGVVFPEYRPDLVSDLAAHLGLDLVDFRSDRMAPLGWSASALDLQELDDVILCAMQREKGVVLHNAESLLACKGAGERRAWLSGTLQANWPYPAVIPLCLFGDDAQCEDDRLVTLRPEQLPAAGLLSRLAELS